MLKLIINFYKIGLFQRIILQKGGQRWFVMYSTEEKIQYKIIIVIFVIDNSMVKFKLTHNIKPKRTEQVEANSFKETLQHIDQIFNVESKNVKFMKPPIKDENGFEKLVKDDIQVLFLGAKRKEKPQGKNEESGKNKKEEKMKQVQKIMEDLKISEHEKAVQKLKEKEIVERGFQHMNQLNEVQDIGTDHFTCSVLLMRCIEELKDFSRRYQVQPKNPDGLLFEDLHQVFRLIDGQVGKIIDPLDWTTSFIAYCGDDIEFPFPLYDFNYVISKIFLTLQNAVVIDQQRREPNALPNKYNPIAMLAGTQLQLKQIKLTKIDEDDDQIGLEQFKTQFKFVLECDYSDPQVNTLEEGVKKRYEEKTIWENFYAFDIEYLETVLGIEKCPQYLFIHTNRIGYAPNKDEGEEIDLLTHKKCRKRRRTKRILDICNFSDNNILEKLEAGRYERNNLFNTFQTDDKYKEYVKEMKKRQDFNEFTENELKYMYFDKKLFELDIFHQYFFEHLKGAKPTGEYRLIGMVLHKGQYYHHPNPDHTLESQWKHDITQCKGKFKTIAYNRGNEWLCFQGTNIDKCTLDDALSEDYWGDGEWTPVLLLYKQMTIRHMQIEAPDD